MPGSQPDQSAHLLTNAAQLAQTRLFVRFEIFEDPKLALPDWSKLEPEAPASAYQAANFLLPWLATIGQEDAIKACIIVGYLQDGSAGALFPFGLTIKAGMRIISFLGGSDSNAQMGLIRSDLNLTQSDIKDVLHFCAHSHLRPDALILINQPELWECKANPFALVSHQPSASFSFSTPLDKDGEAFVKSRLSSDHFKKLKKKERKLSRMGTIGYQIASSPDQVREALAVLLAQKLGRLNEKNITTHLANPAAKVFLTQCCLEGLAENHPVMELHTLQLDGQIIAIFAGCIHQNGFYAMLNSFETDPEIARTSPGELLLVEMIKGLSQRGITRLDFGIGEARYKSNWCQTADPRFDTLIGWTLKGKMLITGLRLKLRLKRFIKQTPWAWKLAQMIRQNAA